MTPTDTETAVVAEWAAIEEHQHLLGRVSELLASEKLVVLVGAGIARKGLERPRLDPKLSQWEILVRHLCGECGVQIEPDDDGNVDFLSVVQDCIDADGNHDRFYTAMGEFFGPLMLRAPTRAERLTAALPFQAHLTLNYDDGLSRAAEMNGASCSDPQSYPYLDAYVARNQALGIPRICHLHGRWLMSDIPHPDAIVLATKAYGQAYGSKSMLPSFLQQVLPFYSCLFIGTSLNDEIQSQLLNLIAQQQSAVRGRGGDRNPHFALLPVRTAQPGSSGVPLQSGTSEFDEEVRLKRSGIDVIRYDPRDGHRAVTDILEKLASDAGVTVPTETGSGLGGSMPEPGDLS